MLSEKYYRCTSWGGDRVYYPWALFEVIWAILAILGISGKNGVQAWPPMESKPAEKTHPLIGGHLRGPLEGRFGPWTRREYKIDPSEMTPMGGVPFSLLDSMGGQDCALFSPEIPQNCQKAPKMGGTPIFSRILSCTSIIFFLGLAQGPKRCYCNPKMGAALK